MPVILAKVRGTLVTIPVNVRADGSVYVVADPAAGAGATAGNQLTMITSLQLIDDLRDALASVGLDELRVVDVWEVTTIPTAEFVGATNDLVYTLPAAYREYYIAHLYVTFQTAIGGAARQLEIQFRDVTNNVILPIVPGVTQAANLTYRYAIAPALADHLGVRDTDYIMTPMPPNLFLPAPDYDVRVFDNNGVSANDVLTIQMQVQRLLV